MKVVIAARTRMQTGVCVGAVCMRDGRALRLLTRTGDHQPEDSPYEVGFAWEIDCKPKSDPEPPHIEDVRVFRKWRVDYVEDLGAYLAANTDVWRGGPDALFGGLLRISERGRGYIARDVGLPDRSTGFWRPDVAMEPVLKGKRVYFAYASEGVDLVVPYFGTAEPPESIPADALVRVSLSRWYAPTENEDEKCWLQLSGVY